jgi:hypothetical protein
MSNGKVIGYLAYITKIQIICERDSCVIAGSREKMKSYLKAINPRALNEVTISKARFGDIKKAMELGAAYNFDEESYNRFYPLAKKHGINVGRQDFSGETPTGFHFVRVQKMRTSRN